MPLLQDPEIYRDILDGLQIGVSVLDLERRIVFWSDGAEHITGYAGIDVLGHPCTESIFLHCNRESCKMCVEKCLLESALRECRPVEAMGFVHHKDGHRAPVRTWATPLRGKPGSITGIILTFESQHALADPDPSERSLQERGWLDEITGLPNQTLMRSHLRETLGSFAGLQIPFGVIMLEPRNLREFRAKYGQEAARSILRVLAQNLRNTVWGTDYVGTWNEEQFLVILSGCGENALRTIRARIQKMTASATIEWWGEELSVEVDAGSAEACEGDTVEALLHRARPEAEEPGSMPGRAASGGASV